MSDAYELNWRQFDNPRAVRRAMLRALVHAVPPPKLLPSRWAEQNIVIPVGNAVPGPIRFDAPAYQRGMIDVIAEPGIHRVSFMIGAQGGKTTIMQCISAYFTAHDPRNQIWLMPSEGDMQTFRETKLEPMFEANPRITAKMDGSRNSRTIKFIGGWMMFSWAGSAKTLRGRSAPVTIADEIDGMEQAGSEEKNEGDPVQLLMQRAASFSSSGQNIHIESSTPTIKGMSRIEASHDEGDCRKFFIPCQHCEHEQVLQWNRVVWNGRQFNAQGLPDIEADNAFKDHDVNTAGYACESCGVIWTDGDRQASVRRGRWVATKPTKSHASFHLSELYSPFRKLRDIAQSYLDKLAVDSYNTFVNVSLAETFEEKAEKVDAHMLVQRKEAYAAEVPMGVLYITMGVDMQADRLEAEIVGWGEGEESWSLGYHVIDGDPVAGDVWEELDELLDMDFIHESGMRMRIDSAAIDTGGTSGATQAAYEYLRGNTGRRLFGIKGVGGWGRPIVEKSQRKESGKHARKVDLYLVGADEAKLVVMRRFAVKNPGPGYCHIPDDRYDVEKWAAGATAERLVREKTSNGQGRRVWKKTEQARNEPLDCRVYATAALKMKNPSFRRLRERLAAYIAANPAGAFVESFKRVARVVKQALNEPAQVENTEPEAPKEPAMETPRPKSHNARAKAARSRRGGANWVNSWK